MTNYNQISYVLPTIEGSLTTFPNSYNLFKDNYKIQSSLPLKNLIILTSLWKNEPAKGVFDIINDLICYRYKDLIQIIDKISTNDNKHSVLEMINNLEKAFTLCSLMPLDELIKFKFDDIHADLIQIKRLLHNRLVMEDPHSNEEFNRLISEIKSKLQDSQDTHEFLDSIGVTEEEVLNSIKKNN